MNKSNETKKLLVVTMSEFEEWYTSFHDDYKDVIEFLAPTLLTDDVVLLDKKKFKAALLNEDYPDYLDGMTSNRLVLELLEECEVKKG